MRNFEKKYSNLSSSLRKKFCEKKEHEISSVIFEGVTL